MTASGGGAPSACSIAHSTAASKAHQARAPRGGVTGTDERQGRLAAAPDAHAGRTARARAAPAGPRGPSRAGERQGGAAAMAITAPGSRHGAQDQRTVTASEPERDQSTGDRDRSQEDRIEHDEERQQRARRGACVQAGAPEGPDRQRRAADATGREQAGGRGAAEGDLGAGAEPQSRAWRGVRRATAAPRSRRRRTARRRRRQRPSADRPRGGGRARARGPPADHPPRRPPGRPRPPGRRASAARRASARRSKARKGAGRLRGRLHAWQRRARAAPTHRGGPLNRDPDPAGQQGGRWPWPPRATSTPTRSS